MAPSLKINQGGTGSVRQVCPAPSFRFGPGRFAVSALSRLQHERMLNAVGMKEKTNSSWKSIVSCETGLSPIEEEMLKERDLGTALIKRRQPDKQTWSPWTRACAYFPSQLKMS